MRLLHPELVPYVRGYNTGKDYLEALVTGRNADGTQRALIRDTRTEWAEADGGAAAVDALFTRFDNGDLRLKDATNTLLTRTSHPNNQTDLNRASPIEASLVEWSGTEPNDLELLRVKFWLNPRLNASQKREVVKWRLEILALSDFSKPAVGFTGHYVPIAEPLDVSVTGDAAGEVTFDYSSRAVRPQPKRLPIVAVTLFVVTALNASGDAAANVALGVNDAETSFSVGGQTLRRRRFSIATGGLDGGKWTDAGLALGVPHIVIENGTYTAATITFSAGNLFDLGGAPTEDVELTGLVQTPPGTSVTLDVRNDADTGWVAFTNGQFEEANLGLTSGQLRKLRATLTPNVVGNLSPTLRRLGRREVERIDFSRVATIEGYEQAFDPETHTTEIPRPRLVAVKDGPRDFSTKIEKLLAEHFINDILIRWWVGQSTLSRDKWTHMEDFLVLDSQPRQPVIELQLVGLSALLKDLAPPFSPGTSHAPDGTQSAGSWTDLAGSAVNLHLNIDEVSADETDAVRSGLNPSNQAVVFTLPTPTDIAGGRRLFVDCDYQKDAAGGQTIDLTIRLRQGGSEIAFLPKLDIGPDRVQSTMELTETQRGLITNPADLRIEFVANASGGVGDRRVIVTWARFRSGGKREVVTYTNQTLKAVYDDLLANRLSIPANLRGPGVESTAFTVSKQITGLRTRKPGSKDVVAKTELEAIAYIADHVVGSSEGRIKAFDLSPGQPIRAIFRSRRIRIGDTSPGHERRIPEYFVPYRWEETKGEFKDEARAFHTQSLLKIGTVGLGPPKWLEEEIAKWIDSDALAEAVGKRTVERLGTGKMLWSWQSVDRYPELEMGDVVAVETDQFVSRDPNVDIEVKGRRWVVGPLQRVGQGRFFTIHVRGYADILASVDAASRIMPDQVALTEVHEVFRGGNLFVQWVGSSKVRSVKVATSTTSQPAAGTGTAANGSTGEFDAGSSFAYGDTVYITVTPYSDTGGAGVQGAARELRVRLWQAPIIVDPINGRIFRTADFSEGGFALKATTADGLTGNDAAGKLILDFDGADITVTDAQGTPVTRARFGKVGAGAMDYGVQVFDQNAATVMDFTGAKRILAVPVQDQGSKTANFTIDFSTGLTQRVQLGASGLVVTFSNPTNGQRERVWYQQDTVGSRTLPTHGDTVMWEGDTPPTLSTGPGVFDVIEYEYSTIPSPRFLGRKIATNVSLPTPQVQSITSTSFGTASTTHNVNMPATVDAGDLLLMLFARSGTSAVTTPTGWSLIASQGRLFIFAKDAVGNEDGTTVNVATDSTETAAAQVYRITRWGGTVPTHVEASFGTQTTSAFPDPPAHAPAWSVDRDLWIAVFGSNGSTVVAYPTDYTNGTDTLSGAGDCTISSARRARYATTENPGTFELFASQTWNAATVAVRPPV